MYGNPYLLGSTVREEAELIAREGQGFIAFNPRQPAAAPESLPPSAEALAPTLVNQAPGASQVPTTTFVATAQGESKSLAREVLPVLAVVIGIPFLVWLTDRQVQQKIRGL